MPKVSVLLPARNEESRIERVILSLQKQTYPHFDVWLGNDQSTDGTLVRMQEVCRDDDRFHIVSIPESLPHDPLKGKTHALQCLGDQSSGEWLLFTDADMELPPTWIQTYVQAFQENPLLGVVVGTTLVRRSDWQSLEWLWVLQGLSLASQWGLPTTGMGNNMAVSRQAWDRLQGFRKIPFSIVEDYALYHAVINAGFSFQHLFSSGILGWTLPPENLIEQRARWIHGAWKTRSPWLLLSVITFLMIPFLLLLFVYSPTWGFRVLIGHFLLGILWGGVGAYRLDWRPSLAHLLLSPWVLPLRLFYQVIRSIPQRKISWKGRHYEV